MGLLGISVIVGVITPLKIHSDVSKANEYLLDPLSSLSSQPTKESIKGALVYIADKMDLNKSELLATIRCESSFEYDAVGKAGEIGAAQFMPSTWKLWNKKRNTNLDIYSTKDQLNMLAWAFKNGFQHHWSCFKKYFST